MASTVWKGYLTFGLVSIPVRLYAAARSKSIRFNQLYRRPPSASMELSDFDIAASPSGKLFSRNIIHPVTSTSAPSTPDQLSRVHQELHSGVEQKAIDRQDLVKGYQYGPGQYVVVEKDEMQGLVPKTSTAMDLFRFVVLSEIDPIYLERSYYVAPETGGEKPYALLFQAMLRSGYCGLAKVAMHRREHVVVLRPHENGIVAHTMYYVDEIRDAPEPSTGSVLVTDRELSLAEAFIKALAGPFEPENFRDEYRAGVQELIKGKLRAQQGIEPARAATETETMDLMDALKASLERLGQTRQPEASLRQKPRTVGKSRKRRSA